MPTILITGAKGQLGMELQVIAKTYPTFSFHFYTKETLPITNEKVVNETLQKIQPDYVINCAAYTAVDKAETNQAEAFLINAAAVSYLAQASKNGAATFIHISTDYVFDGTKPSSYSETDATNPISVYGASKLQGELLALQHNPSTIILRTSWVYSIYGHNFVKTMLRLMQEKPFLHVVNDQVGSPTYAFDLAEAILQMIQQQEAKKDGFANKVNQPMPSGIFHFSNEGSISWFQLAMAIKNLTNSACIIHPISTAAYPTPAKRPLHTVLNKNKYIACFNLPIKPWQQSLQNCIHLIS